MNKQCPKCKRKYKQTHQKKELSIRLCKLMGWDSPSKVQNTSLAQSQIEELCIEIERFR